MSLSIQEREEREAKLKGLIVRKESLEECLPYVNGQAFYEDKRKLFAISLEIDEIRKSLRDKQLDLDLDLALDLAS